MKKSKSAYEIKNIDEEIENKNITNTTKQYALCHRPLLFLAFAIWEAWCFHFDTLGDHFRDHPAGSWQQNGQEVCWNSMLINFWMITIQHFVVSWVCSVWLVFKSLVTFWVEISVFGDLNCMFSLVSTTLHTKIWKMNVCLID